MWPKAVAPSPDSPKISTHRAAADSRSCRSQDSFERITPAKALGKEDLGGCPPALPKPWSRVTRAALGDSHPHRHCLPWYCPGREIRALPREILVNEADASS